MKTLSLGLAALVLLAAGLGGCGRHPSSGPSATGTGNRSPGVAAVAVKPESATGGAVEHAGGMTEESEGSSDIPTGLSPIAAAVAANTPASSTPIPSKWVDGQNYTTLVPAQPTSTAPDKVEIVEVFWYGCGHCFHLDPTLEDWRHKHKAPYVEFVRVPIMWNDLNRAHARLFYTIEALGKQEQLHSLVFREIHVNGQMLAAQDPAETEKLQRAFLKANGVSDADFDKTYRSFSVESKLQRADQLWRRYKVSGVPTFIVNGKYIADVGTAGGEPQLITLLDDLAASEHKH